jgi:hypothetical protein
MEPIARREQSDLDNNLHKKIASRTQENSIRNSH